MARPPLPPFTRETAIQKVRMAEDAWNTRDPERVSLAYTRDSRWRNRAEFLDRPRADRRVPDAQMGEGAGLPADQGAVGVRRATASPCASPTNGTTTPATGFAPTATRTGSSTPNGLMRRRFASINDLPITRGRPQVPLAAGPRPDDHPGLSDLGL